MIRHIWLHLCWEHISLCIRKLLTSGESGELNCKERGLGMRRSHRRCNRMWSRNHSAWQSWWWMWGDRPQATNPGLLTLNSEVHEILEALGEKRFQRRWDPLKQEFWVIKSFICCIYPRIWYIKGISISQMNDLWMKWKSIRVKNRGSFLFTRGVYQAHLSSHAFSLACSLCSINTDFHYIFRILKALSW